MINVFLLLFALLSIITCYPEWIGYQGGEIKEAVEGKEEQGQEDSWSKEGKEFSFYVCLVHHVITNLALHY